MDLALVRELGSKALLAGAGALLLYWTITAVKLVLSARGINPLIKQFFTQVAAGRIDAAYLLTTKGYRQHDYAFRNATWHVADVFAELYEADDRRDGFLDPLSMLRDGAAEQARAGEHTAEGRGLMRAPALLRLLLVALVAWGAASWWAAGRLMTPHRTVVSDPPAVPGAARVDVTLRTDDGLDVAAWIVTPDGPPRAVCVVLHPLGGARSWPRALLAAGPERGHLASGGRAARR